MVVHVNINQFELLIVFGCLRDVFGANGNQLSRQKTDSFAKFTGEAELKDTERC